MLQGRTNLLKTRHAPKGVFGLELNKSENALFQLAFPYPTRQFTDCSTTNHYYLFYNHQNCYCMTHASITSLLITTVNVSKALLYRVNWTNDVTFVLILYVMNVLQEAKKICCIFCHFPTRKWRMLVKAIFMENIGPFFLLQSHGPKYGCTIR